MGSNHRLARHCDSWLHSNAIRHSMQIQIQSKIHRGQVHGHHVHSCALHVDCMQKCNKAKSFGHLSDITQYHTSICRCMLRCCAASTPFSYGSSSGLKIILYCRADALSRKYPVYRASYGRGP